MALLLENSTLFDFRRKGSKISYNDIFQIFPNGSLVADTDKIKTIVNLGFFPNII